MNAIASPARSPDPAQAAALLAQAILVVRSIEEALVRSNLAATAEGLHGISQLLAAARGASDASSDELRASWQLLRVAVRAARAPLAQLDDALAKVHASTRQHGSTA